jgi:hypothetical protein
MKKPKINQEKRRVLRESPNTLYARFVRLNITLLYVRRGWFGKDNSDEFLIFGNEIID